MPGSANIRPQISRFSQEKKHRLSHAISSNNRSECVAARSTDLSVDTTRGRRAQRTPSSRAFKGRKETVH